MRFASLLAPIVTLTACSTQEPVEPDLPQPLDVVWADSIHAGDLVVMVPGTGSYQYLAQPIEAYAGSNPLVDVRTDATVAGDAIVFEQAIAAAHRAGISNEDLEAGALTFGLWGAGFTRLTSFDYESYEGITIHVAILGGENSCATGSIFDNLFKYNTQDADTDASDLYTRTQSWLAAHPSISGTPRNVIVASHSWGGAVAEYLAMGITTYESAHGPLTDGNGVARMKLTIAAGVPGFILGAALEGPGLRDLTEGALYEVDRPDDPVHAMNPSGNGDGHQYSIMFGDEFQGSYGVTTTQLSCRGVPGACNAPST